MARKDDKRDESNRRIALDRMERLFSEAEKAYHDDPSLSDRYVEIARNIGMKLNVSIPSRLKRRFCKSCHSYLVPSSNSRIRVQRGKIVTLCLKCKTISRFPYSPRKDKAKEKRDDPSL